MFVPYALPGSIDLDGHLLVADLVALDLPVTADTIADMRASDLDEGEIRALEIARQLNIGTWLTSIDRRWPVRVN